MSGKNPIGQIPNTNEMVYEDVVKDTLFHMLKIQDRGNVEELTRLLLNWGMRTYLSGGPVKSCIKGKPQKYRCIWILGVPWDDNPQREQYRGEIIQSLDGIAQSGEVYNLDATGNKGFRVSAAVKKAPGNPDRSFKLIPVPNGLVQKAIHATRWKPSDILLTLTPRKNFKALR
jgi:hypothetical protein